MAYIDNFDEETIIDVATQYGSFMNAYGDDCNNIICEPNEDCVNGRCIPNDAGRTRGWKPPVIRPVDYRSSNGGGIDKYENDFGRTRGWRPPVIRPVDRVRAHINPLPTDDLHRNQVGAVRPTRPNPNLGGGQPRFQATMTNMGCNGLRSRRDVLASKLDRFQTQGIRPAQQMQLREKITFIDNQIAMRCSSIPFSGSSNMWMSGDY